MLKGIDISKWQATTPSLAGLDFAFARATYATSPDGRYATHVAAFRRAGLVAGAYHFGVGFSSAAAQARVFLAQAKDADLLILDLERDPAETMTHSQAREFIDAVHAAGRTIGLYHSRSGFPSLGQDYNWVAQWGTSVPTGISWAFWQYRGSPLDLDYFNGTKVDLLKLAAKAVPPLPASPTPEVHLTLKANAAHPVQTTVDVKKGGQVFRIDGSPLVTWSADYTITSLGQSGAHDLIVVTTAKVTQYALVLTAAIRNRRSVGTPANTPPPPLDTKPPTPAPPLTVINRIPERIAAQQPDGAFTQYGWEGQWENGWSPYGAWVARPRAWPNMLTPAPNPPIFILVHGGPLPVQTLAGMDSLAAWIAARGGIGVALKYPMLIEDGTWREGRDAIQQAVAKAKATGAKVSLVGHSAGGFFISLAAFGAADTLPDRVVYIAADDQVGNWPQPTQPPNPRGSYGANALPVTVIVGSVDPVTTVEEGQAMVDALATSGHPGRWLVIDGAGHSNILSDVSTLDALR
jgi:hypothetical protein